MSRIRTAATVRGVKYATLSKSVFAVTAVLIATACADSAEVPAEDTSPTEPAPITETKLPAAKPAADPPAKVCPSSCATDADCATGCPALAGGVQCCDTKTKTCWGSKTSACPKPADPTPDPTPAY